MLISCSQNGQLCRGCLHQRPKHQKGSSIIEIRLGQGWILRVVLQLGEAFKLFILHFLPFHLCTCDGPEVKGSFLEGENVHRMSGGENSGPVCS
jgi:hypothetical protein